MLRELWFEGSDAGPGAGGAYGRGGRRGGGLSNTLAVTPQRGRKSRNRYGDENGRERERVDRRSRDRSARDVRDWDRGDGERYSRSDRDRDRDARDYRDRDSGRSRWSNRTDGSRPLRNDRSRSSADKLPLELLTESGYEIGGGMRYSQNFGAQPGIMNTSMNASLNMSASYGSMGQMGIGSRGMDLNMMGGSMNNLGGTGLSVDNIIEGDLMQSFGGPMPGGPSTGTTGKPAARPASASPALNEDATATGAMNGSMTNAGVMIPSEPLPANASLVALNLENALMPFKKLYLRKEQKREEARSRAMAELKASMGPNPLEEDIRAITAINAAAAGVPMIPTEEMRPVFARRTDRPRGLAHSVDFTAPGLAYGANVDEGMLSPRSGQYRRGIDALDLEIAAARQQVMAGTVGFGVGMNMSASSPGSFYPFDKQRENFGSFDPAAVDIPPPPPETPMELRGKQNVPQTQATDTKQESTGANQSNEDSAPESSSAQTSKAANAETDTSATNAGKESDIEAQLASLEKTVREKTGKIEKSIAEVNNVLGPAEPVLETKPRPGLPSSLSDAADHISESLDIWCYHAKIFGY